MGRVPCCDKNGLKKGPWTPEEDQKLIDYIQKHGYGNWRTLPKNAGLQRCGKSCRLRWTNYLRPDIKRGSSLYNSSQMNISRLLGVQPMVNANFSAQNQYHPIVQASEFQSQVPEMPTCTTLTTPFVPFSNETQLMDPSITDLSSQDSQLNHQEWQSDTGMASNLADYMTTVPSYNDYYGSDQTAIMDPSSETTSTFISNNGNQQNFSFASVLSTPSSSSTPLNSNSTYINGSSSTEDERESYCSNMLKFEIPDSLDVSNFM
ncbi:hypothetical protein GH714_001418 [Hevea brasiliensis]|uniref:Uncharacterized protein n=1 Tax=Hevea brasiliensis TaxID=3981 RepID=A0A6A6LYE2_HEVBR|nr:hypothetical protein GH714_001418 [Hevea brasiliensis]